VVGSFEGVPLRNAFAKRYELHYQLKTVETPDGDQIAQYGCLNFHAKRDGSLKLSLAIKNKWATERMKSWFYCRVPYRRSFKGEKSVHALHSRMSELDYSVEPVVKCSNNDPQDDAFIRVTSTIRGHDAVEEYVACKMYPLATSFGFENMALNTMPVSKVETPLPLFAVENIAREYIDHVLAKIETEAKRVLVCFGPK
jgi:hypothetical protein